MARPTSVLSIRMRCLITLGILLGVGQVTWSAPSPIAVGVDFQFLIQNDLDWPTISNHNASILLNSQLSNRDAVSACSKLNEGLLSTTGNNTLSDLQVLTRYLEYDKQVAGDQKFWVASKLNGCQTFSFEKGVQAASCSSKLPALCSQSAPYKVSSQTDPSPVYQVQVQSKKATYVGTRDHLSFRFIGIPYANPFKRYEYSKPYTAASPVTLSALSYGASCLQGGTGSEDCLFLNIYTPFLPADSSEARKNKLLKPVLLWIHGGGFTSGQSNDAIFDGGNMASRNDLVYVSINYRLGALGFLALDNGVNKGNFGIADQITALQWVKVNIAAFGGDPSRVTIHGQSAGAGSVRALLGSPPAFGLFAGAIAQSNLGGFGYATSYTEYPSLDAEYAASGVPLIKSVGCDNSTDVLACLRAIPASTIINAPIDRPRKIVVDGHYITNSHLAVNGKGPVAPAHIIFGFARDDGSDFVGSYPSNDTTLTASLASAGLSDEIAKKVIAAPDLFPMPTSSDKALNLFNLTSQIGTLGQFVCIDQATVFSSAKHRTFPSVYAYSFDRTYAGWEPIPGTCEPALTPEFPNGDPNAPYFRCHSGELYYTAGTLGQDLRPFRDPGDLLLSQWTVDTWGSFARTFNPNPPAAYLAARGYTSTTQVLKQSGPWKQVSETSAPLKVIDVPFRSAGWRGEAQCKLLGYPLTMFE
ncbi:cholinesterase [Crepidotus variabilis]|uniref:Carboxylic ester hydrolase n=1 Tax=Crepidotus variabilis TaxID=179855 RepID=A0A9P6EL10_9AGAR|nr:cholinesterase [Crepidotus variabilis]